MTEKNEKKEWDIFHIDCFETVGSQLKACLPNHDNYFTAYFRVTFLVPDITFSSI